MKKSFINIIRICLPAFVLIFSLTANAQDKKRAAKHWLLPDHASLQYAGGTGFLSAGFGYSSKKDKIVADFMYGYVPAKFGGGDDFHTATAKIGWWPLRAIGKDLQIKPLGIGLLANYTFGKEFFSFTPDHYGFEYYDHPTSLHGAAFISSAIQTRADEKKCIKQVQLYYELLTYDTELVSYLGNKKSISVADILTLGIGVRAKF